VLETLKQASPQLRKAIISNSDAEVIEAISEICHNYVAGNVECDSQHFNDLAKHKKTIRTLAKMRKRGSVKSAGVKKTDEEYAEEIQKKKDILLLKGEGFWSSVLAPLMQDLAAHFLDNIINGCANCRGPSIKRMKNEQL
jgi:hypothetical protein